MSVFTTTDTRTMTPARTIEHLKSGIVVRTCSPCGRWDYYIELSHPRSSLSPGEWGNGSPTHFRKNRDRLVDRFEQYLKDSGRLDHFGDVNEMVTGEDEG